MTDRHTVDQINSDQLDQLYDDLDRLRAGEEGGYTEYTVPTPGQWIHQFNQAPAEKRLEVIAALLATAERGHTCFLMAHERRLDEDRHAWATLARVRDVRAKWALNTLEPGQVRRLLDDLTHALADPAPGATSEAQMEREIAGRIAITDAACGEEQQP